MHHYVYITFSPLNTVQVSLHVSLYTSCRMAAATSSGNRHLWGHKFRSKYKQRNTWSPVDLQNLYFGWFLHFILNICSMALWRVVSYWWSMKSVYKFALYFSSLSQRLEYIIVTLLVNSIVQVGGIYLTMPINFASFRLNPSNYLKISTECLIFLQYCFVVA